MLAGGLVAMYSLAMLSLRRHQLTFGRYTFWGLFSLLIPALGPLLVILLLPGKSAQRKYNQICRR